ncbi:hypothetical protein C8R45DRAFT_945552 [Mycena sanguinolenta]|nr:hypothetical protein C8R45DRAFT_945552 [Mycena sanguinolenta]
MRTNSSPYQLVLFLRTSATLFRNKISIDVRRKLPQMSAVLLYGQRGDEETVWCICGRWERRPPFFRRSVKAGEAERGIRGQKTESNCVTGPCRNELAEWVRGSARFSLLRFLWRLWPSAEWTGRCTSLSPLRGRMDNVEVERFTVCTVWNDGQFRPFWTGRNILYIAGGRAGPHLFFFLPPASFRIVLWCWGEGSGGEAAGSRLQCGKTDSFVAFVRLVAHVGRVKAGVCECVGDVGGDTVVWCGDYGASMWRLRCEYLYMDAPIEKNSSFGLIVFARYGQAPK